jgi:hypothetical protein
MGLVALHDIVLLSHLTPPKNHSLLDGIDMAAEHVTSFKGERIATLVCALALVSIARPLRERRAHWHDK